MADLIRHLSALTRYRRGFAFFALPLFRIIERGHADIIKYPFVVFAIVFAATQQASLLHQGERFHAGRDIQALITCHKSLH